MMAASRVCELCFERPVLSVLLSPHGVRTARLSFLKHQQSLSFGAMIIDMQPRCCVGPLVTTVVAIKLLWLLFGHNSADIPVRVGDRGGDVDEPEQHEEESSERTATLAAAKLKADNSASQDQRTEADKPARGEYHH